MRTTKMISGEQIRGMTCQDRHELYKNARRIGGDLAQKVLDLLEEVGLPYADSTCVGLDDPLSVRIAELINSSEGVAAMLSAQTAGAPPLSGVDAMIAADLGVDYGPHNMTTNAAGAIVVERMRRMGYRKRARTGKLPPGSVAKSAALFEPNA
ncbi:MAG TPA: hypothetical protein VMP03_06405 [Methylomirabilota bacterium]|nr:hypothetical protein [Methylomirabilota bacterium]